MIALDRAGLTIEELVANSNRKLNPDAYKMPKPSQRHAKLMEMLDNKVPNPHTEDLAQLVNVLRKPNRASYRIDKMKNKNLPVSISKPSEPHLSLQTKEKQAPMPQSAKRQQGIQVSFVDTDSSVEPNSPVDEQSADDLQAKADKPLD